MAMAAKPSRVPADLADLKFVIASETVEEMLAVAAADRADDETVTTTLLLDAADADTVPGKALAASAAGLRAIVG